ncbi:hypothetical protein B0H14DRAFT_2576423 [Mycena olivaceomarginata]|nr:hypothetical protein B0H14DRAFT_2576423 [Mycena olivaceomarginata]
MAGRPGTHVKPYMSVTSFSQPSGTSGDEGVAREFDQDNTQPVLSVRRPAASVASTGKMGIVLKKKTFIDVNGNPKYNNADLPFPADSHTKDVKQFQNTVIPNITDWAVNCEDAFAVTNHTEFKPTLDTRKIRNAMKCWWRL